MNESKVIGIDLGTTFSEVAHVNGAGIVEVIPNRDGDRKTPSIVSWASGAPIVGEAARPDLLIAGKYVVQCGKRQMGKTCDDGKPIPVTTDPSGRQVTVLEFSAAILKALKESAEEYLGCPADSAVITVPAYFDAAARDATKAAAEMAGFKKVRLLNEPEAAAIFYGLEKGRKEIVVVTDTGGGTTDVTVIEIDNGKVKVLVTDGDPELGGLNYAEALFGVMRKKAKAKHIVISAEEDLATFYKNFDHANKGKELLSARDKVTIIVEAGDQRVPIEFTRQMLKRASKDLDKRFIDCCKRVFEKLNSLGKRPDRVLLVGGNSRLFHVAEMVREVFGLEPSKDVDPDFVVVKGSALWAEVCFGDRGKIFTFDAGRYLAADIALQTVAAHAICVAALRDKNDHEEYNVEIVPANTPLPYEFQECFAPANPGSSSVVVKIVQGKPGELSANSALLYEIVVPIKPSDKDEPRIELKGRYTEEGLVELNAVDKLLGKPISDSFIHKAGLRDAGVDEGSNHFRKDAEGGK
jgi:molecular chaperone DnaK